MTQPTAEQLELARECAESAVSAKLPGLMGNDFKGNIPKLRARIAKMRCAEGDHFVEVQSAILAIQATEARMSAAVEADVEKVARIIDPSSWAVMDGYLSDMLRKYKGQKIGYDPDAFKHKPSMKIAEKVIAAIRSQSNG